MQLADLDKRGAEPSVVLLQTPSVKLTMFLEDKVKRHFGCRNDAVIDLMTKSDVHRVREVIGIVPPFSDRWYVRVDLDKFNEKRLVDLIAESSTCVFFCTCSKYKTFKEFKDSLKNQSNVFDFYINYLRRRDFIYLYDGIVPKDKRLVKQLFDYVVQSYSGDIDAIFDLFIALNEGKEFKNRKDITKVCGIGGLSIESIVFSLLKPLSGSDKGLKLVIKRRLKAGVELADSLGYSSLYNFMSRSISILIQLKMLIISGDVYKHVHNLPDCYDEKAISRYQKYIWRLKELPLSELLRLKQSLGKKCWRSELDWFDFVYRYYKVKAISYIKENGGGKD